MTKYHLAILKDYYNIPRFVLVDKDIIYDMQVLCDQTSSLWHVIKTMTVLQAVTKDDNKQKYKRIKKHTLQVR